MQSLWNDQEAGQFAGELGQRVYTSRLLGREAALVLHGGGNTSVKVRERNILGEEEDILYVKGSGWNLATVEAAGFAPLRLQHLLRLVTLDEVSDTQMVAELRRALVNPDAPGPSVETLTHALLPYKYVDHTHADPIIALMNTADGRERVQEVYGDQVVIIPYALSGFRLAKTCSQIFPAQAGPQTLGMLLMKHGVFTFGDTAKCAYERMVELATRAESYLQQRGAWHISIPDIAPPQKPLRHDLATLRREISRVAGFPMIMATHSDAECLSFARRDDVAAITQRGCASPGHILRTRRVPLIGRDVEAYRRDYETYFATHAAHTPQPLMMRDPAPRVLLDPEYGMGTLGTSAQDAAAVHDIYRQTIRIILHATALGGYEPSPPITLFGMEYWELEQARMRKPRTPPPFAGEVALVTGAASDIGRACVEALLARGAAVAGLHSTGEVSTMLKRPDFLALPCDATDSRALEQALEATVQAFGGLDMLIIHAGIISHPCRIADMSLSAWHNAMHRSLDSSLMVLREACSLLRLAPRGGRVVIIASSNVDEAQPGAAATSSTRAALEHIGHMAAEEWHNDGIRVNMLHPTIAAAPAAGGTRADGTKWPALPIEKSPGDPIIHIAELSAEMCGPLFATITGTQLRIGAGSAER